MGRKPTPIFPVIDLKATGKNINRLRKEHGMSAQDLQHYLGLDSKQAVYRWFSGTGLPTIDNFYAMSALFHVPIEKIIVQAQYRLEIVEFKQGAKPGEQLLFCKLYYFGRRDLYIPITLQLPVLLEALGHSTEM